MAKKFISSLLAYNSEVSKLQKTILELLKKNPNLTKEALKDKLYENGEPVSAYQLEHEIGFLQGKNLLDDKLQVINIKRISDLTVISDKNDEAEELSIRSEIVKGFYSGTNTVAQNRKWLREILNHKSDELFALNPDKSLELVLLKNDRRYLRKDRIPLKAYPCIKCYFELALNDLKHFANSFASNTDEIINGYWQTFVTLLTDFIVSNEGFFETYDINYNIDEDGNLVNRNPDHGRPETFEDYEISDWTTKPGTKEFIKTWKLNLNNELKKTHSKTSFKYLPIPSFGTVYSAISDALNVNRKTAIVNQQQFDSNVSSYCNIISILDEINARYIGWVTDYLSEATENINNAGRKARNLKLIDQCNSDLIFYGKDGYINLDMFFVALWCLYWRIYYKEL